MPNETHDTLIYNVVVNDEGQYSIWPAERKLPLGWRPCDRPGTKQECLDYITVVWTDMRPVSVRQSRADAS
jgi:MbtH protein